MTQTLTCPHCGSTVAKYNVVKSYWRCLNDNCEKTFDGVPPSKLSDYQPFKAQQVFISYGHDDNKELVFALKECLCQAGHKVWIDYEQIDKAQDWRQQIADGIKNSDRILSFLSKYSVRDPGVCLDEIGIALSDRHGAIATLLVEPEHEVKAPASVSHIQYCNLSDWREKHMQGEAVWQAWLQEQSRLILDIIARESGFAGDMDSLRKRLTPLAQHQLLGALIKQPFVGRSWVFDALEEWRSTHPEDRMFLITGAPGMGKSMISAHLAHYAKLHAVAYHFCRWDSPESRNPQAFICNLAYQLAARNANYRSNLRYKLDELSANKPLQEWSSDDLFTQLINEAGAAAIDGGQTADRQLVVIDALDEAPEIAQLLGKRFAKPESQPPAWLGFVVTTRPEQQIPESLSRFSKTFALEGGNHNNLKDLERYIDDWSIYRKDALPSATKELLITRSEGNIYYLNLIWEGCRSGRFDLTKPESLPEGLKGVYQEWFNRQFNDCSEAWARAKPLLRILCACPEPVPLTVMTNVLGWRNEDDEEVLAPFGALIRWNNQKIQLAHRSFADWLVETTGTYRINPSDGRIQLAIYLWEQLPQLLEAKTPEFGHLVLPTLLLDSDVERCSEIFGGGIGYIAQLDFFSKTLENISDFKIRQARLTLAKFMLKANEDILGANNSETLEVKAFLGRLIRDVDSNLDNARELQNEALETAVNVLGCEHPSIVTLMDELAVTLSVSGDFLGARALQEKVYFFFEK